MYTLVRKTLEIYLKEKRLITQSDFPPESIPLLSKKDAIFVTLYHHGRVIASSGRIQCQKENSLYETIDSTLTCLKDSRFQGGLQTLESLEDIYIRLDILPVGDRRMLQNYTDLNIREEGLIFLSINRGIISVVLPHMVLADATPEKYFLGACKKGGIDPSTLAHSEYIVYGFKTIQHTDMQ